MPGHHAGHRIGGFDALPASEREYGGLSGDHYLSACHCFYAGAGLDFQTQWSCSGDVFYRNYSPRTKAWINSLGIIIFLLPFCVFLFLASLDFVTLSWSISETSNESGGLPIVYLLKSLIPLMCIFLALQATAELLRNACILCCQDEDDAATGGNPS